MLKLLELLKNNAKLTNEQLASMLGMSVDEVAKTIAELEKNKTIVCYSAVVNWDKTEKDTTTGSPGGSQAPTVSRVNSLSNNSVFSRRPAKLPGIGTPLTRASCSICSNSSSLSAF